MKFGSLVIPCLALLTNAASSNQDRSEEKFRKVSYLAVYLSADESFEDAEKVVTTNISPSGCFVYSAREWEPGSRVWLIFFGDEAVVCGTVCSSLPWGNNKLLPGIGIRLDTSIPQFG